MHSTLTPATKRCLLPHAHNLQICCLHCKGTLHMQSSQGFGDEEIILGPCERGGGRKVGVRGNGTMGSRETEGDVTTETEVGTMWLFRTWHLAGTTWRLFLHPHTILQGRSCGFILWMKSKRWGYGAQGHRKVSGCQHKTPLLYRALHLIPYLEHLQEDHFNSNFGIAFLLEGKEYLYRKHNS